MSELKITKDSIENAILKDGQFVSGYVTGIGYISASGDGAHAEGYAYNGTIDASGNGAHAEGISTQALADGAHAEGGGTTASGQYSHAEGYNTQAGGGEIEVFKNTNLNSSIYSGQIYDSSKLYISNTPLSDIQKDDILKLKNNRYTISSINTSYPYYIQFTSDLIPNDADWALDNKIQKMYIETIGNYSHAEGINTRALADGAHAGGLGTTANSEAMTAIGKYNNTSVGKIGGDYLFVVGNGTAPSDASRSNAFAVTTNGITATTLNLSGGRYQEESDPDIESDIPGGKITWSNGNCYIEETDTDKLTIYAKDGLQLETDGVNININNDTIIAGNVKAQVNDVSNVYLGCPIGTVVMWPGETAPNGWLLCDGTLLECQVTTGEEPQWEYDVDIKKFPPHGHGQPISWYFRFNNREYVNLGKVLLGVYGISIVEPGGMYLPNFKGLFPIGAGKGTDSNGTTIEFPLGDYTSESNKPGEYSHTLTKDEMPIHNHTFSGIEMIDNSQFKPDGGTPQAAYAGLDINNSVTKFMENAETVIYKIEDGTKTSTIVGYTGSSARHNNIPPYLAINFIIKYK